MSQDPIGSETSITTTPEANNTPNSLPQRLKVLTATDLQAHTTQALQTESLNSNEYLDTTEHISAFGDQVAVDIMERIERVEKISIIISPNGAILPVAIVLDKFKEQLGLTDNANVPEIQIVIAEKKEGEYHDSGEHEYEFNVNNIEDTERDNRTYFFIDDILDEGKASGGVRKSLKKLGVNSERIEDRFLSVKDNDQEVTQKFIAQQALSNTNTSAVLPNNWITAGLGMNSNILFLIDQENQVLLDYVTARVHEISLAERWCKYLIAVDDNDKDEDEDEDEDKAPVFNNIAEVEAYLEFLHANRLDSMDDDTFSRLQEIEQMPPGERGQEIHEFLAWRYADGAFNFAQAQAA